MKIAIVGSRNFNDYSTLKKYINNKLEELDIINDVDTIVSGGAKGADSLGERYAEEYSLEKIIFPAEWNKYGKRAGFIRNEYIIQNCDVCFAFWDGESHGTKHDIDLCKQYNKDCYIWNFKLNKEV